MGRLNTMKWIPVPPRLRERLAAALRQVARLAGRGRKVEKVQQLLVQHAVWLKPGDWAPVAPEYTVWYHRSATVPDALIGRGGKAGTWAIHAGDPLWVSLVTRAWLTAFATAGYLMRLPKSVAVPAVEPRRGNATAVVKAGGNRADFVALETETWRALRLGQPGSSDAGYIEVRRRYQRHLPAPGFSVSDEGAVLVEEWSSGQVLKGLPVGEQVEVITEVLNGYAELVAAERFTEAGSMWQALPRLLDQVAAPAALRESLADPRVRRLLTSDVLIPSKGELAASDILVKDDGSWQVVDFDEAKWLPFWSDPVTLLERLVRQVGKLERQAEHALTGALDHVWVAAGFGDAAGLASHHWVAMETVRAAWSKSTPISHSTAGSGYSELGAQLFVRHLHQRARRVEAHLSRP